MLSEALALIVTDEPDSVAPAKGAVIETVGAMVSIMLGMGSASVNQHPLQTQVLSTVNFEARKLLTEL